MLFLTSIAMIAFIIFLFLGFNEALKDNFYLLAFGLYSKWDFCFLLYKISLGLSILSIIGVLIKDFKSNIPLYFMILLAIGIYHYYFLNWGFVF